MFENVEQLEKEIREFEQNVLASRDLIINLRNINDAIKTQNETVGKELQKVIAQLKTVPDEISEDNITFQNMIQEGNKALYDANKKDLEAYNLNLQKSVDSIHFYEAGLEQRYDSLINNTNTRLLQTEASFSMKLDESTNAIRGYCNDIESKYTDLLSNANQQYSQTEIMITEQSQKIIMLIHSYESALETKNSAVIEETKQALLSSIENANQCFKEESGKYIKELISSVTEMKRYEQMLDMKYRELLDQMQKTNSGLLNQINNTYKAVNSKSSLLMILVIISIVVSIISIFI